MNFDVDWNRLLSVILDTACSSVLPAGVQNPSHCRRGIPFEDERNDTHAGQVLE